MHSESVKLGRRYHLHLPGLFYIGVTIVLGVGAIKSQNNLLFIVFGVALSALVVSGLMSGAMLMGLLAERRPVVPVGVGDTLKLTYVLRNRNRFIPAFALTIGERPPRRRTPSPARWTRLIPRPVAFVAQVGARGTMRVQAEVLAERRGAARLEGITVTSAFPFGVFRKSLRFRQDDQLIVLPEIRPLSPDIFHAISARARVGDNAISKRGLGDEFYGLRDYVRGDSPRLIDWKASARSGALVSRISAQDASTFLRVLLLLDPDAAGSDLDPTENPNERAITLAASLVHEALGRMMQVGLAAPQAGILIPSGATSRHRLNILKALALIDLSDLDTPEAISVFGAAGPTLVIAPDGARHPLAPPDVPALGVDALARWSLDRPRPAGAASRAEEVAA